MKKESEPIFPLIIIILVFVTVSAACNLSGNDGKNLSLDSRAENGSVSGKYHYPADLGEHEVNFSVTIDGFATFRLEDAPESETLTVELSDNQTASLEWNGTTFDGLGVLTGEEQATLDNLMDNNLAHSLGMIPLDVGCQGDEEVDAKQVAALLVPLQMRFKYSVSDRAAETKRLIALSECDYGSGEEDKGDKASFIMFSPSMPVPVVFGYFPFDAEGAMEAPISSAEGLHTVCLDTSSPVTTAGMKTPTLLKNIPESISGIRINERGPCNALCRGACGADCPPSNCDLSNEMRCEKDEEGRNTGMEVRYLIYDCGLHQGCIDHDNCYDACNEQYGCGTWQAAHCRHGWVGDPITAINHPDWWCDQKAVAEHGIIDPPLWSRGYGPQPMRETFEYLDEDYDKQRNLEKCAPEGILFPTSEVEIVKPVPEDEKEIPVGTYIYGPYVNDEPPPGGDDWEYDFKSEFSIRVANDGTVTGFRIYRLRVDSEQPGCVTRSEEAYITNVNGFLEGNQGSAILEIKDWDFWEYHGEECGDGKDYFNDEESVYEAIITVSGNQMEISRQGKVLYTLTKE